MKTYVLNAATKVMHLVVDGRSFEGDNLDALKGRTEFIGDAGREQAEELLANGGARACPRCFPSG